MKLIPLQRVQHRMLPDMPLPWNVRDADGQLLLARGLIVCGADMLRELVVHGAFVDLAEVAFESPAAAAQANAAAAAPEDGVSARWTAMEERLSSLLRSPSERFFLQRVRESLTHVAAIASGHTDQLIFLVLRHGFARLSRYSVAHALHVAALSGLLARRVGWDNGRCTSVMGAALTMNLTILDLQGALATRGTRPTAEERRQIAAHPQAAAALLRTAGLTDEE